MNDQTNELSVIERKLDRERTALIPVGHSPGQPYGIVFRNVGEVMEWAKMMALDPTMPKHLQGKPATCLHVISDAIGWQMDSFKVAPQSFVINGVLCYMAQMTTAVINKHAPIKGRVKYSYGGEGDKRTCTARVTCSDDDEVVEYTTPEIGKITPKNSPLWKNDPDQQLSYYAGRALCRRYFPDVLLSTYFRDEIVDNPKMIEHREYERIANPLGGVDDASNEDAKRDVVQEMRQEPAGASEAETGGNQPQEQKPSPEPPAEAGNGKKRTSRKQTRPDGGTVAEESREPTDPGAGRQVGSPSSPPRPDPGLVAFPKPWNRQSAASYVQYALGWVRAYTDADRARGRWADERAIRNGLANPLDKMQMVECQDALGKVGI